MESYARNVTLQCAADLEDVVNIFWFIDGEQVLGDFVSSDGVQLTVPCLPKYNGIKAHCIVQFHGGNATSTAAWITVSSGKYGKQLQIN